MYVTDLTKINYFLKMNKKPKNITMKYIAETSNVSIATVSRAFDPTTKNKVNAKTLKKIKKCAEKLGYMPNRTAQALSRGGTKTIGLILPAGSHFSTSEFFSRVIMNATVFLRGSNFDLKVHILKQDENIKNLFALKQNLAVDGLLLVAIPFTIQFNHKSFPALPIVMMSSGGRTGITTVCSDNIYGSKLVASYFHKKGHKKFGMLTGPADSVDAIERVKGFKQFLKRKKIKINKNWFVPCLYGEQEGYEAGLVLLKHRDKPTAVFCTNDETAFGLMRAAKELGINCPEDISIIGFDNHSATQCTMPPITTIEQPTIEMTATAVELLLKLIKNPASVTHTVFPVEIIERQSA